MFGDFGTAFALSRITPPASPGARPLRRKDTLMIRRTRRAGFLLAAIIAVAYAQPALIGQTGRWVVIGWNNLGMHCLDADFSLFATLPPYNTIQAQVIDANGRLVKTPGVRVQYRAVADPTGSINTTSRGKTNFWTYVAPMFGVSLGVDRGLAGSDMPGATNAPQPMAFDAGLRWFTAEGIPITPIDDAGRRNAYPLMEMAAVDTSGRVLATTVNTLPVSDEMDCSACHASGTVTQARPVAGWAFNADAQRDFRINILRLHDERQQSNSLYATALAARGLPGGLYASAMLGKPALCASCHASNALTGSGYSGITALTAAMHGYHSRVSDPVNGLSLDASSNRAACYRCHPGSVTRCLRGTMGNAVAEDGSMAIQCQNCHGSMSRVGNRARAGWFDEPTCQQCHTGSATRNGGAIRFTSVFNSDGTPRTAVDPIFATTANTPVSGVSLYRFSAGHGGLQCAACHGSTHAEYPASHANDNLQSIRLQGHVGTVAECNACHTSGVPRTVNGGPHGMHPVGAAWVSDHGDYAENNPGACTTCHGADYRGTELSRTFGARTMNNRAFFKGQQVGCYTCHNGPRDDDSTSNRAPVASSLALATAINLPGRVVLAATDADRNPLTFRIVSQPANGTVGLSGGIATYFPFDGVSGPDAFTYTAWDGSTDSNLATVSVIVGTQPPPPPSLLPTVSQITAFTDPFRLRIDGTNFSPDVRVFIGSDTTAWPGTTYTSSTRVLLSGSGLSAKFPRDVTVGLRLVNPDGGSVMTSYRRR